MMIAAIRSLAWAALALAALAAPAGAQSPAMPIEGSSWSVDSSWQARPFVWKFRAGGRYKDSDGPTGSWSQEKASIVLRADAGFTYQGVVRGEEMTGTVKQNASGQEVGGFVAHLIAAPEPPVS